jgi:hypothetical protein
VLLSLFSISQNIVVFLDVDSGFLQAYSTAFESLRFNLQFNFASVKALSTLKSEGSSGSSAFFSRCRRRLLRSRRCFFVSSRLSNALSSSSSLDIEVAVALPSLLAS